MFIAVERGRRNHPNVTTSVAGPVRARAAEMR
jgi:hypothetical protein